MTDKERLEQLAAENKQKRQAEADRRAAQLLDDETKTTEIAEWGKTLLPQKVVDAYDLRVEKGQGHHFGLKDAYVFFWVNINLTNNFTYNGKVPLLAARCHDGAFELRILGGGPKVFNLFHQVKDAITECLAKVDTDFMQRGVEKFCQKTQWSPLHQ